MAANQPLDIPLVEVAGRPVDVLPPQRRNDLVDAKV